VRKLRRSVDENVSNDYDVVDGETREAIFEKVRELAYSKLVRRVANDRDEVCKVSGVFYRKLEVILTADRDR